MQKVAEDKFRWRALSLPLMDDDREVMKMGFCLKIILARAKTAIDQFLCLLGVSQ